MGKSHQRGWVVERGKKWYGYYRKIVLDPITNEKKTDVLFVILGLKSQLTKGAARSLTVFRWTPLSSSPCRNISSISLHFSQRTG
jgi:hypothetical protein